MKIMQGFYSYGDFNQFHTIPATYGQKTSFSYAPKLWNTLPQSLKQYEIEAIFKKT